MVDDGVVGFVGLIEFSTVFLFLSLYASSLSFQIPLILFDEPILISSATDVVLENDLKVESL